MYLVRSVILALLQWVLLLIASCLLTPFYVLYGIWNWWAEYRMEEAN